MLKFQNITKVFKSELLNQPFVALNDVSFEIPSGSMVGFLGANGAGKTTSIKIIMDFIRADQGTISYDSSLGSTKNEILKKIGFLPERPYFYSNLTGMEFLNFMGSLSELSKNDISLGIKKWAPRFKIEHALQRELKTYSKGMLQRIGFLATILHGPQFIILDEPLSGLDPIGRKELKDVMVEVHKEGKTVFFSSHIVPDIEEVCDRVIFLQEGKLVYDGSVSKLIGQHQDMIYVFKVRSAGELQIQTESSQIIRFPDNLHAIHVSESQKANLASELLSKGIDLVGMEPIKPSLEDIFYKTKERA